MVFEPIRILDIQSEHIIIIMCSDFSFSLACSFFSCSFTEGRAADFCIGPQDGDANNDLIIQQEAMPVV